MKTFWIVKTWARHTTQSGRQEKIALCLGNRDQARDRMVMEFMRTHERDPFGVNEDGSIVDLENYRTIWEPGDDTINTPDYFFSFVEEPTV